MMYRGRAQETWLLACVARVGRQVSGTKRDGKRECQKGLERNCQKFGGGNADWSKLA